MKDNRVPLAVATVALVGAGIGVAAFASRPRLPVGNPQVPEPAKPVELKRYLGFWYEIARYENGFERGLEGVTAEYRVRADGRIQVLNTARKGGATGRVRATEGWARVVAGSQNAKLKVAFFGPFFLGDYWVLDHADDYAWSIVGEPTGRYLWLLSRNPYPLPRDRDAIVARARALGYETQLIRPTEQ